MRSTQNTNKFTKPILQIAFRTKYIGKNLHLYDKVVSTNDLAVRMARESAASGLAILAKQQTAGRGQYGRVWQSEAGDSMLLSLVVEQPMMPCSPVVMTALAAVAVAEVIDELTLAKATIKWPNDVLVEGRKIAGILLEQILHPGQDLNHVVIGVGINLNQSESYFEKHELTTATSCQLLSGRRFEPLQVAEYVINRMDQYYTNLLSSETEEMQAQWIKRLGLLQRSVQGIRHDQSVIDGVLTELSFQRVRFLLPSGSSCSYRPEEFRGIQKL